MSDLKACPLCGAAGEELGLHRPQIAGSGWNVVCYVCHIETAYEDTQLQAVAAWNRRVQHGDLAGAVWELLEDQEMTPTTDEFGEACYLVPVASYEKVAAAHRAACAAPELIAASKAPLTDAGRGALGQGAMSKALDDVAAERRRQVDKEGWTPDHDDQHGDFALAAAAACYAYRASRPPHDGRFGNGYPPPMWPGWATAWWKPKSRREDLIRAAALIIAEVERLDRRSALEQES